MTGPNFAEVTALVALIENKRFANAAKQLELLRTRQGICPQRLTRLQTQLPRHCELESDAWQH